MAVLAQVGYGKGEKVQKGIAAHVIKGAILSPRDEEKPRLEAFVGQLTTQINGRCIVLFDPQFHASTISDPNDGYLSSYSYYQDAGHLDRTGFTPRNIQQYVKSCLSYQRRLNVTYILSPTVIVEDFTDLWSQTALNLADEAVARHTGLQSAPPLLISVIVSAPALRNTDELLRYLDALSRLDVEGFYIVVCREQGYHPAMDSDLMANLMYAVYVLGDVNRYMIVAGYSDWLGLLLEAAGATHFATGWFQNLRQFSPGRFDRSSGGRRPKKRYSSGPLLSSILIQPELQDVSMAKQLPTVLSRTKYDGIIGTSPAGNEAGWTDEINCLHHWATLSSISREIYRKPTRVAKLEFIFSIVSAAIPRYRSLKAKGIQFSSKEPEAHLKVWRESISEFRRKANI